MIKCSCYHKISFGDLGCCWGTKKRYVCYCGGNKELCDFYERPQSTEQKQEEKPKIEPKFGEWISVKDMLPEKHTRVLCYFKYEPESPNVIVENYYYSNGHWLSEGSHVTHWMPLPKAPEEEC